VFFARVDPRPAGLMRIAFGTAVLWTFADLAVDARVLFTDEGMWLTSMSRSHSMDSLGYLWDPESGFPHWWSVLLALPGRFTLLHFRSDPPFVFAVYAGLLLSLALVILGRWTRPATVLSWVLAEQLYRYNPLFQTSGDFVVRVFLFLAMFLRWGEAYSLDSLRRRRALVLGDAAAFPSLRRIPAWPLRLMMVQLAVIYCLNGLHKSGSTWRDGTALYYALNLDHFYRVPAQGVVTSLQSIGVLPVLTWTTRWWELLFPLALAGVALRGYEHDRRAGRWPRPSAWRVRLSWVLLGAVSALVASAAGLITGRYVESGRLDVALPAPVAGAATALAAASAAPVLVAAYRLLRRRAPRLFSFALRWVLGRRVWLGFGVALHAGIDLGLNVGTFPQVMVATYPCWLTGADVEAFWRYVLSRPLRPGEGARPVRGAWTRLLLGPLDRLRYRAPACEYTVFHHPGDPSVRRAATLRLWDVADRLRFVADPEVAPGSLEVAAGDGPRLRGGPAAAALAGVFPVLWWLCGIARVPGMGRAAGRLGLRVLQHDRILPVRPGVAGAA
jgi:hypothetical protein